MLGHNHTIHKKKSNSIHQKYLRNHQQIKWKYQGTTDLTNAELLLNIINQIYIVMRNNYRKQWSNITKYLKI